MVFRRRVNNAGEKERERGGEDTIYDGNREERKPHGTSSVTETSRARKGNVRPNSLSAVYIHLLYRRSR